VLALKVNGREVYTGERVPCDVPIVLVVGNSTQSSREDIGEIGDSLDAELLGGETDGLEYYEEEL
jgi:hypothetical protein